MSLTKMEDETDLPISIFKVPESLSVSKPEAYVPQLVGLGPYHHDREDLKQMRTFKIAQVKKIIRRFPRSNDIGNFGILAQVLKAIGIATSARSCYASPFDMEEDDLVCVIVCDGLYLLELLRRYVDEEYNDRDGSGFFCDLVNFGTGGNKSPRDIAARDATILENQIPIHSLKLILTAKHWDTYFDPSKRLISVLTENLSELLLRFAAEISPLGVLKDYPLCKVVKHPHLLDLLYSLATLKTAPKPSRNEEEEEAKFAQETARKVWLVIGSLSGDMPVGSAMPEILSPTWNLLLDTVLLPLKIPVKLIQGLVELPWSKIWLYTKESLNGQASSEEEVLVNPGAFELRGKGVKFCPIDRIPSIKFDHSGRSFSLPPIKLDANSEVVLRNLVAYEAAVKWKKRDSLVLARYLELMSELAKSCQDVKSLIDANIIEMSSLKEDEVVGLFAAMSKPVRATNAKYIDEAVSEVVCYYNGLRNVLILRSLKKWGSIILRWCLVFTILLALLVLVGFAVRSLYEWLFDSKSLQAQLNGLLSLERSFMR